jgi:hypothetical protein
MICETRHVLSRRPYAVDMDSLTFPGSGQSQVRAAWFRRRRGATVACAGVLWDFQGDPRPKDVPEFLRRHDDGRYGGRTQARWDGDALWTDSHISHTEAERLLTDLLRPMLDNYPDVPRGFDGWWVFER